MMKEYAKSINNHYSQVNLGENILAAYERAGKHAEELTREDISSFDDGFFDVIWLQHTIMNIEDKPRFFKEACRLLRTEGRLAIYEICAGSVSPPYYPVPWASDSTINFLATPEELRDIFGQIGFKELVWRDVSTLSLEWFLGLKTTMASRPEDSPQRLGLNLLMGRTSAEKAKNVALNLEEDRIRVVQCVLLYPSPS